MLMNDGLGVYLKFWSTDHQSKSFEQNLLGFFSQTNGLVLYDAISHIVSLHS